MINEYTYIHIIYSCIQSTLNVYKNENKNYYIGFRK